MGWAEQKAQQISLFFVNVLILVAAALLKGYLCKCSFHALLEGNVFLLDLSCLHTMAQMGESLGTCIWDFLQWFSCSELSASSCGDRIWLLSDSRKEQGLPAVLGFSLRHWPLVGDGFSPAASAPPAAFHQLGDKNKECSEMPFFNNLCSIGFSGGFSKETATFQGMFSPHIAQFLKHWRWRAVSVDFALFL